MPSSYASIKARREADPQYAERLRSYAKKYKEANLEKERERHRVAKAKLRESDREAYNAKMREYNKENVYPEKAKKAKERREKNPEYSERVSTRSLLTQAEYWRHWKMKKAYGIGIFEYRKMYAEQEGKCAICDTNRPDKGKDGLVVDHCHDSGHIRKLLCVHCNTGLGQFRDNVQLLAKAIDYLNRSVK